MSGCAHEKCLRDGCDTCCYCEHNLEVERLQRQVEGIHWICMKCEKVSPQTKIIDYGSFNPKCPLCRESVAHYELMERKRLVEERNAARKKALYEIVDMIEERMGVKRSQRRKEIMSWKKRQLKKEISHYATWQHKIKRMADENLTKEQLKDLEAGP